MRAVGLLFLFALLTLTPVVLTGLLYSDGTLTDNTYNRSLEYDSKVQTLKDSILMWEEPICSGGRCQIAVTVSPTPDNDSVVLRIFQPADSEELAIDSSFADNRWHSAFTYHGSGWYISKLEYTLAGTLIDVEKSFYVR
ncbi:MAG: hypothetical protein LBV09_02845 [Deferribacteraceae bacterium]|jgi:hypothetical protein|nr:hypothetical protein [Deferribacteraceae bacterium]